MKAIDLDLDLNINNLAHTADIHIRTVTRHQEYSEVFQKFFKSLVDNKVQALFVLGDTVHSKTQLSPELVNLLSKFMITADQVCPTFYIPGNHDINLTNLERKDVISSLFSILDLKQSYYLKDTAVYRLKNIDLYNYSLFDQENKFDNIIIDNNKVNIALYHGVIDGSSNEYNYVFKSDMNANFFKAFDILLLGDIHKRQQVSKNPLAYYPGSLIQQNFGEELKKGYLIWESKDQKSFEPEFIHIENNYGFYKIFTEEGNLPELKIDSKYPRFMVYLDPLAQTKRDEIAVIIKTQYPTLSSLDFNDLDFSESSELETEENTNYYDINVQNNLIYEYLHAKHPYLDEDELQDILKINQSTEDELKQNAYYENPNTGIKWELKKLKFINMFKYGEDNVIDFQTLNGLTSITGKNAIGKTSLLEIIIFALYGRTRKDLNIVDIINSKEKIAITELDINIAGIPYKIIRTINVSVSRKDGSRSASGAVQLECLDIEKETQNQNDDDKRSTDKKIASLIGTFDDFIELNIMSQNNWLSFITNSDTKQKDTLVSILGLKTFEEKQKVAKQLSSEFRAILKDLQKSDYKAELGAIDQKLKSLQNTEIELKSELEKFDREKNIKQKELNKKEVLLKDIEDTDEIDISKVEADIENTKQTIIDVEYRQKEINEELKKLNELLEIFKRKISDSNLDNQIVEKKEERKKVVIDIESKDTKINELRTKISPLEQSISSNQTVLKLKERSAQILIDEPWHEEELICQKCSLLSDAFVAKNSIDEIEKQISIDKDKLDKLISEREKIETKRLEIKKLKLSLDEEIDKLETKKNGLEEKKNKVTDKTNNLNNEKIRIMEDVVLKKNNIRVMEESIKTYLNNKESIEFNKLLQKEIAEIQNQYNNLEKEYKNTNDAYIDIKSQISSFDTKKQSTLDNLSKMRKIESQYKLYEYYIEAVHRNGVPAQIIRNSLSIINTEINKMLNTIVDFSLKLELVDDNLKLYIIRGDNKLTIKGSSGMESIISELIMRIALLKISSKPKTNMLAIDEGFLALDEDTRASLPNLFSFIRKYFRYILIITHEQSFKDYMDKSIEIDNDGNYSFAKTVELGMGGE